MVGDRGEELVVIVAREHLLGEGGRKKELRKKKKNQLPQVGLELRSRDQVLYHLR